MCFDQFSLSLFLGWHVLEFGSMYVQRNKNIYWSPDLLKLQVGSLNDKLSPLEHNSFPLDSRDVTRAMMLIRDDAVHIYSTFAFSAHIIHLGPTPHVTCTVFYWVDKHNVLGATCLMGSPFVC